MTQHPLNNGLIEKLHQRAITARENAHAPYSKFKVGCAILTTDEKIFSGCNVENASFGATICAERSAVCNMVSELGKTTIHAAVIVTETNPPSPPCGMCLQVLSEFCDANTTIYLATPSRVEKAIPFTELLPNRFTEF